MDEPMVLSDRIGAVRMISLNRPTRLNAMTKSLVAALIPVLEDAAVDPAVRCVVLTGVGRGFCAGGDLGEVGDIADGIDVAAEESDLRRLHHSSRLLHEMAKPTIAAVNGPCAGAGLSWACACDLRIAATSAVFRSSFVSAGLTGDFGSTWTLPRIVGAGKARELCLLNLKIDAAEAQRIGLVSEVVPDDSFRDRVLELATRLAAQAPLALAGMKANLNDGERHDFGELLDREAARQAAATASSDCVEAATAFIERRAPVFTGA
ncbi:enoyl-CoA hydratase/isomerase family protein [Nocardioides sp. L-11A]|uniref:enoyl-CoA hydratase/isomerase family protein n=1 Tax=Nocardioides sp. L-11A TaxID=3043848 RepID=UPI00249C86E8|nr:enoyl-CoA hydratase-related protein [Nocardioides sp. L-11A]